MINGYRTRNNKKANKLESMQLQKENEMMEERMKLMKIFVESEKKKDQEKKSKKPRIHRPKRIRGYASKVLARHQENGLPKFPKRGLAAYQDVLRKKNSILEKKRNIDVSQPMKEFLQENGLERYFDSLKEQGVIIMQDLIKADIKDLGLKPGHEIKLKKRIDALKRVEEDKSRIKIGTEGKLKRAIKKKKQEKKIEAMKREVHFKKERKPSRMRLKRDINGIKKQAKVVKGTPKPKSVSVASCSMQTEAKDIFLNQSCWFCCKLLKEGQTVNHPLLEDKTFCSKECLKTEFNNISTPCEECSRVVMKLTGLIRGGFWFCGEGCYGQHEQEEEKHAEFTFFPQVQDSLELTKGLLNQIGLQEETLEEEEEEEEEMREVDLDMDFV